MDQMGPLNYKIRGITASTVDSLLICAQNGPAQPNKSSTDVHQLHIRHFSWDPFMHKSSTTFQAALLAKVRLTSSLEVSCTVRWTIIFFTKHPLRHLHPVLHRTNRPARSVATTRHSMAVPYASKMVTTPNVFFATKHTT
eukprot:g15609.t1